MQTHKRLRASSRPLALLVVALTVALGVANPPAGAETTLADVALDSQLELFEENEFGAYRHYAIRLTIHYGTATLSLDKDGRRAQLEVPLGECQAMWRRLLDSGLETLTDSPIETLPDQSHFTVEYRIVGQEGAFEVHSVDELADPRYRYIIGEILAMGDTYLALADPGGQP